MDAVRRGIVMGLLVVAGGATAGLAQEAELAMQEPQAEVDPAAVNRSYVKGVLDRPEVRTAARVAGVDMDRALEGVDGLEGDRLDRATRQAQLLDRHLGESQDRISLSATTLIIVLLLVLIIILVA